MRGARARSASIADSIAGSTAGSTCRTRSLAPSSRAQRAPARIERRVSSPRSTGTSTGSAAPGNVPRAIHTGPALARIQARPGRRLLPPPPGVDLSLRVAELTATRRIVRVRVAGERRYIAAEEAGRYRDALLASYALVESHPDADASGYAWFYGGVASAHLGNCDDARAGFDYVADPAFGLPSEWRDAAKEYLDAMKKKPKQWGG